MFLRSARFEDTLAPSLNDLPLPDTAATWTGNERAFYAQLRSKDINVRQGALKAVRCLFFGARSWNDAFVDACFAPQNTNPSIFLPKAPVLGIDA